MAIGDISATMFNLKVDHVWDSIDYNFVNDEKVLIH